MNTIKRYYSLIKPGILYGNSVTVIGAFLLASHGVIDLVKLAGTLVGIAGVIGSAAVYNNIIDRDIDALMERTKNRAIVRGLISIRNAKIFASVLGIVGIISLSIFANVLTAAIAFAGFVLYVFLYSLWTKRNTPYATMLGTLSGAVPPLVGYVAVSGVVDPTAIILFLMLVFWQMPHALSIALYRHDEYRSASIPVLPIARGMVRTKIEILIFTILFASAALSLGVWGSVGYVYLGVAFALGGAWIIFAVIGFFVTDTKRFGRKMFFYSLIVLMTLFIVMAFDNTAPSREAPVMAPIAWL